MSSPVLPSGQRVALVIEYDGASFNGWQLQAGSAVRTVQGELENALGQVADQPVRLTCAGRTDTGVHATHQVAHFDAPVSRSSRSWLLGSNRYLPDSIVVRGAHVVPADFHARFSALSRRYLYLIHNSPVASAIAANRVAWVRPELNAGAMHDAAQILLGEQDFSSFRAAACQSSTALRCLHYMEVRRQGELVLIEMQANAFLYHMARNIAGALIAVGRGQLTSAGLAELLQARDRRLAPDTAAAHGLYLTGVTYPDSFDLPVYPPGPMILQ